SPAHHRPRGRYKTLKSPRAARTLRLLWVLFARIGFVFRPHWLRIGFVLASFFDDFWRISWENWLRFVKLIFAARPGGAPSKPRSQSNAIYVYCQAPGRGRGTPKPSLIPISKIAPPRRKPVWR